VEGSGSIESSELYLYGPDAAMGQMRLKYEDGTVEGVVLYLPFGTIQQGEEYRKADLHELRDYLKSKCREIDRFLQ